MPARVVERAAAENAAHAAALATRAGDVPQGMRAHSTVRLTIARTAGRSAVARLYETGGLRVRFPNVGALCEGVFINTGGGIAGGDSVQIACAVEPAAAATLTTQSAEKIYRAERDAAQITAKLTLGAKAKLAWVPQETILFNGASLTRTLDVEMAADATLTVLESVVFGRLARAERLDDGRFQDRWRIRRDGRLVFADDIRLDGDLAAILDRSACGDGARAIATLLHVAPKAEARLVGLRRALKSARSTCGTSAYNGLLVARFASANPDDVRRDVQVAASHLLRSAVPRVWAC
jgi:urease accessory protein